MLQLIKMAMPFLVAGSIFSAQFGNALMDQNQPDPEAVWEISYQETLEELDNPGRGFYKPVYVHYKKSGNQALNLTDPLVHLRLDVSEFAATEFLSEDMLQAFEGTLEELEKNHCSAIIRFAYDVGFEGKTIHDPPLEYVLSHQAQIAEVISRHAGTVTCVECGMYGRWGELHSTKACTTENFNAVMQQWLDTLPPSVPVSFRTVKQYCDWRGISLEDLASNVNPSPNPGEAPSKAYRVGIYDDGYLASDTDLGTYEDREKEIAWLKEQTKHAIFGGELSVYYGGEGDVRPTAAYIEKEAYLTHLTYLNSEWNFKAISALKKENYQGEEELYHGQTGYAYVRNHLGYRFVVRGVNVTREIPQTKTFQIQFQVENVGFGNLVKPKELELILVRGDQGEVRVPLTWDNENVRTENVDPAHWDAKTTQTVKASFKIPEEMALGDYQVYVRIADPEGAGKYDYPIRFANVGENVWNEELEANFLCNVSVTEKPEEMAWSPAEGLHWK